LRRADTSVLSGDVATAIGDLKLHHEGELLVPGSGVLVRWLLANDFVDQLDLVTYPVVIGQASGSSPTPAQTRPSTWSHHGRPRTG
jgi:dihydrofolate reductase